MTDTPTIQVTVAAPVDTVWAALRDKDKIRHWHGWEFTGGPDGSLDQEIDLIYFTDVTVGERAVALNGGDRVELAQVEGGTRVTLTRAPRGDDPDWASYYDDITEGWITFMNQLRFAVERHPHDVRRTVFLSGTATTSPLSALAIAELSPGDKYELDLPGETATGQVWYRSEHQLGLTVNGWNDGLLVLSHNPTSHASMALLSLYAIDESRHTELTKQWHVWWTDTVLP
ncbi:SRPBCC family protein [Nocardioides speluncae]|uniref:SRPBCC family protein n=1 Tax=Nocardioides speluncae TaxID=2670337 RepID=UPI000D695E91|nr:SRPBCC domain-containing protein [Nocardioides speluncae]